MLANSAFLELYPLTESQHLSRQGSDHAPIQVICHTDEDSIVKPFRFLNFWCKHNNFLEMVKKNWQVDFLGEPFMVLYTKLSRVKKALRMWSNEAFGNIFTQRATLEDIITDKKAAFEIDPSPINKAELKKTKTELKRYIKLGVNTGSRKKG